MAERPCEAEVRVIQGGAAALDTRSVTPEDCADALQQFVKDGRVSECVVLLTDEDGAFYTTLTDMTNTQFVGFTHLAVQEYIHRGQHPDSE